MDNYLEGSDETQQSSSSLEIFFFFFKTEPTSTSEIKFHINQSEGHKSSAENIPSGRFIYTSCSSSSRPLLHVLLNAAGLTFHLQI